MIDIRKDIKEHFIGIASPAAFTIAACAAVDALNAGPIGITCLGLAAGVGSRETIDRLNGKYNVLSFGGGIVGGLMIATHGLGLLSEDVDVSSLEQASVIEAAALTTKDSIPVAMIGDEPLYIPE